ncbi:pyridoxal-phosphate-dependent aminotransferase family protein [Candidatus Methanoprimaticola sp. MG2]|uniref:pyridoxal-phosphate-dependent aminotransferase family protein n=1 Tax=Candidatus Methanoprimaticola sp. MG2 TaxID=3228838 RepID=UPI0039C68408
MLYTVGPVHVAPDTLESMTKPMITHRSGEYKELHANIVEKIRKALDTDMDVFLVAGSATVFNEGAIRNAVNERCLGITNGSFGNRLIEIAELNGKAVDKVQVPWGKAMKPEDIAGKVGKDIEAVHWAANESSTGVFSDSVALSKAVSEQNPDALKIVDAVTAAFAMDMKVRDMDADAIIFGTQKDLGLPPGLAIMLCGERMLEKAKTVKNRGFYTDLLKIKKQSDTNYALTTPPVSLMYGLDYQLDKMLKEGMSNRYARHAEMAALIEDWADRRLAGVFPEEGYRSKALSVLNRGELDFDAFHKKLKAKGYEISNGYGEVKEKTFRIGHMGDVTPAGIRELLAAFDEILEE